MMEAIRPWSVRSVLIETATSRASVALGEGDRLVCESLLASTRRQASDLVPSLQRLLATQGWSPKDIGRIIVSTGPGSYTGLRVGIMSAKAFAYATGCELFGVPTFEAIAAALPEDVGEVEIVEDAQQGKLYIQTFARVSNNKWEPKSELRIEAIPSWLANREAQLPICGPGLEKHKLQLECVRHLQLTTLWPTCTGLLKLGTNRSDKHMKSDLWSLEPTYLRASSAEQNWNHLVELGKKRNSPAS